MTNDSAAAAAPRMLLAEVEPVDGEAVDGQPAADPPADARPEDPDAQPLPRPLLIEVW